MFVEMGSNGMMAYPVSNTPKEILNTLGVFSISPRVFSISPEVLLILTPHPSLKTLGIALYKGLEGG